MGAHGHVRFQQVVLSVLVRHPVLVEEDEAAGQAQLLRELAHGDRHPHLGDVGVGVAEPEEEQAHVGTAVAQAVDGPEEHEGVEPVVDTAAPDDDLVLTTDAGHHAFEHLAAVDGRGLGKAERHHGHERLERLVVVVGRGIDAALGGQLSQPEVALLGAGAEEEVAPSELLVDGLGGTPDCVSPRRLPKVACLLQLLEVEGVVDVHDDDLLGRAQEREVGEEVALEDEDVAPVLEAPQVPLVDPPDREAGVGDRAGLVRDLDCLFCAVSNQR